MHEYSIMIIKTIAVYLIILFIFRLMGKREVGELSVLDLVIFLMMGEMAAISLENVDTPVVNAIIPMVTLMLIQIFFSYLSLKSKKFRTIVDGSPTIIINKGKINEKAMRMQRYNFDDLLTQLRAQNIINIEDVEYAILETSGQLSVIEKKHIKKPNQTELYPLIMDGEIQEKALISYDKNELWLRQELKKRGYTNLKLISYCSYIDGKFHIDEQSR